jgi:hypothetical protein
MFQNVPDQVFNQGVFTLLFFDNLSQTFNPACTSASNQLHPIIIHTENP